jgi:hypothetical protein
LPTGWTRQTGMKRWLARLAEVLLARWAQIVPVFAALL